MVNYKPPHIVFIQSFNVVCIAFKLKNDFLEIARIPGIKGCVKGTHVRLQRPTLFEKAFVNCKNYHLINVQGYTLICQNLTDGLLIRRGFVMPKTDF